MRWLWLLAVLIVGWIVWSKLSGRLQKRQERAQLWSDMTLYQRLLAQARLSQDAQAPAYAARLSQAAQGLGLEELMQSFAQLLDLLMAGADPSSVVQTFRSVAERLDQVPLMEKLLRQVQLMRGGQSSIAVLDAIAAPS